MTRVTKSYFLIEILRDADQIIAFNDWLNYTSLIYDDKANRSAKIAWDQAIDMDIESSFVQNLIPALIPSVLKQEVLDRFNAVLKAAPVSSSGYRSYDLSPISGDLNIWIRANRYPADAPYSINGDIVSIAGLLPLREVL